MKYLPAILLFFLHLTHVQAQQQETECRTRIVMMDSLVGVRNYTEAKTYLSFLTENCITSSEKIYHLGEEILQYELDIASPEAKEEALSNIFGLYDQYDKAFPNNNSGAAIKKAVALHRYRSGTEEETLELLEEAFSINPSQFTTPEVLYLYFDLYQKQHRANAGQPLETLLGKQDAVERQAVLLLKDASSQKQRSPNRVTEGMDALISDLVNCDSLLPYYSNLLNTRKTDTIWLRIAGQRLLKKNCVDDPLFLSIAKASHQLAPSAESAYQLGTALLRSGNRSEAGRYFDESAALTQDEFQKANMYYTIGSSVFGISDKAQAKRFMLKALEVQPQMGKAYMYLAQLYANSGRECGTTPFEQQAIYWLAAQTARKAVEVDPMLRKMGSDKVAADYEAKAPSSSAIKSNKMKGKTITYACWINETIKVPRS